MKRRTTNDIWKGLFDFYLIENNEARDPLDLGDDLIKKIVIDRKQEVNIFEYKKHILSHQDIHATFILVDVHETDIKEMEIANEIKFYNLTKVNALPKPILIDTFLREKIFDYI